MKRKQNYIVYKLHHIQIVILHLLLFFLISDSALSLELKILPINPYSSGNPNTLRINQLPHSKVVKGNKNITAVWFGGATDRYQHGILGDILEASQLLVETSEKNQLSLSLPYNRVFEDLEPRLVDLNRDNIDEIIVIESDINRGASLALYVIKNGQLKSVASTPFLGRPNRWLNPVGVGDFDGNGQLDIALVATPHIGGVLQLYHFSGSKFHLFAEYSGISNHKIGSMDLGLGCVVESEPNDLLIVPNQSHRALLLLKWTQSGIEKMAEIELNGQLDSSLIRIEKHYWRFRLKNGDHYELYIKK